jgi:hypothetical protein
MIAIRKNWREKGIRANLLGSNPHSNGLLFSLSEKVFFEVKFKMNNKSPIKIQIIFLEYNKRMIIYTNEARFFDWKSNIMFILYK